MSRLTETDRYCQTLFRRYSLSFPMPPKPALPLGGSHGAAWDFRNYGHRLAWGWYQLGVNPLQLGEGDACEVVRIAGTFVSTS